MLQGRAITWPNSRFHPAWIENIFYSASIGYTISLQSALRLLRRLSPSLLAAYTDSHHLPSARKLLLFIIARWSLSKKKAFVNLICTLSFMSAGELSEKFQFVVVLDRYFVHILIEIVRKQWQLWWKCTRNWLQKATVKNINLWAFT